MSQLAWHRIWSGEKAGFYVGGVVVEGGKVERKLEEAVKGGGVVVLSRWVYSPQLYMAYSSKPGRRLPLSRCGAGTEDMRVLIRYKNSKSTLLDKLEVNSCAKGVLLRNEVMEAPMDPTLFIEIDGDWIEFWNAPPLMGPGAYAPVRHRYKVSKDRFMRQP